MPSDMTLSGPRHLVKDWHVSSDRTPSVVRVAPSPCRVGAFAPTRGITRSPPPVSLRARWWLSPPRSGFRRRFTRCARTPLGLRASGLDPWPFDLGPSAARRLLQSPQPASTTARIARLPPVRSGERAGVRLRAPPSCSLARTGQCGVVRAARRVRDPARCAPTPAEVSRVRSWPAFAGQRVRHRSLELRQNGCYPDPIHSDTSRRETAAPSTEDSLRALRAASGSTLPCEVGALPAGGDDHSAISPRDPDPVGGRDSRPDGLACARPPRAEGRALRTSAKRAGARRTRGAFHR
jgi:hypothetical protein